jgi:hypothetical protein
MMMAGYRAVLTDTNPQEWMVETATNFENAIDVAEDLQVGVMACADSSVAPTVLRKRAP